MTTGTPNVTWAWTVTFRSSRSPNASARASVTDRSGSRARYSPASSSTADHAAGAGGGGQEGEPVGQPVLTRPHLHRPGPLGPLHLGGDLVGRDPGRDPPRLTGHPGRVQGRQPPGDLGVHPSTRVRVEAGAGVQHLVRGRRRNVTREHQVQGLREAPGQVRPEPDLPPGQAFGEAGLHRHHRRRHPVHEPHRVHPLHRSVTGEPDLHPRAHRGGDTLRTLGRVHESLELTGDLERLHRIEAVAVLEQLTTQVRAFRTQCRDAAADRPPVHDESLPEHTYERKPERHRVRPQQNKFPTRNGTARKRKPTGRGGPNPVASEARAACTR